MRRGDSSSRMSSVPGGPRCTWSVLRVPLPPGVSAIELSTSTCLSPGIHKGRDAWSEMNANTLSGGAPRRHSWTSFNVWFLSCCTTPQEQQTCPCKTREKAPHGRRLTTWRASACLQHRRQRQSGRRTKGSSPTCRTHLRFEKRLEAHHRGRANGWRAFVQGHPKAQCRE
jgi:hypothetical protein